MPLIAFLRFCNAPRCSLMFRCNSWQIEALANLRLSRRSDAFADLGVPFPSLLICKLSVAIAVPINSSLFLCLSVQVQMCYAKALHRRASQFPRSYKRLFAVATFCTTLPLLRRVCPCRYITSHRSAPPLQTNSAPLQSLSWLRCCKPMLCLCRAASHYALATPHLAKPLRSSPCSAPAGQINALALRHGSKPSQCAPMP